jgi:phosphoribosyl-ATP pyrophosphohydrolase/phosphoribosyl-AMP cyclohydrolase
MQVALLYGTAASRVAPRSRIFDGHQSTQNYASLRTSPRATSFLGRFQVNQRTDVTVSATPASYRAEKEIDRMSPFLDSLKWDSNGLVVAIAQDVDTGEVLMQAFADRNAINETLQTGLATFYSRSRKGRWCKGETSGHFIKVVDIYMDCDRDSIVYLSEPIGPACHTNAPTCYFTQIALPKGGAVEEAGNHHSQDNSPMTTLFALERTIKQRREASVTVAPGEKPSWTAKLINNPELCCKKVREEAGELCQTWEANEGKERAASEAADLIYHAMVLLNVQDVSLGEVCAVLRSRFGTSGIEEKASRAPK